jgi:hypothetical protein
VGIGEAAGRKDVLEMRSRGIVIVSLGAILFGLVPAGIAAADTGPCPVTAPYCHPIGQSGHNSHQHGVQGAGQIGSSGGHRGGHH